MKTVLALLVLVSGLSAGMASADMDGADQLRDSWNCIAGLEGSGLSEEIIYNSCGLALVEE
jgi:hypothetical protein